MNYYVDGSGYVHSMGNVTLSDSIYKADMKELSSPLSCLGQLRSVSFNYKNEQKGVSAKSKSASDALQVPQGATPEISRQIAEEQGRKRIGLIAQEVEQVFPEAVRTQYDGSKGVLYGDMVAVLVAALNEMRDSMAVQASQLADMQRQLNAVQAVLFTSDKAVPSVPQVREGTERRMSGWEDAVLYQNTPNPFNRTTTITYRLPSQIGRALLTVYNLNGVQLKQYELDASEVNGKVVIEGTDFTQGIYIYALIIEGQLVDAKRMVLTN